MVSGRSTLVLGGECVLKNVTVDGRLTIIGNCIHT